MLKITAVSLKQGRSIFGAWAPFLFNSEEHQRWSWMLGMSPLSWRAACQTVRGRGRKEVAHVLPCPLLDLHSLPKWFCPIPMACCIFQSLLRKIEATLSIISSNDFNSENERLAKLLEGLEAKVIFHCRSQLPASLERVVLKSLPGSHDELQVSRKPTRLAYSSRAGDSLELAWKPPYLLTCMPENLAGELASKLCARVSERQSLTHNHTGEDFWEMCFQASPLWCRGDCSRRWCWCWVSWQPRTLPVSILKTFSSVLTTWKTLLPYENERVQGLMTITNMNEFSSLYPLKKLLF